MYNTLYTRLASALLWRVRAGRVRVRYLKTDISIPDLTLPYVLTLRAYITLDLIKSLICGGFRIKYGVPPYITRNR